VENVIERAVLSSGTEITPDLLPDHMRAGTPCPFLDTDRPPHCLTHGRLRAPQYMDMLEEMWLEPTEAAERFHVPLSTLNQKIKRLSIEIKKKEQPPRVAHADRRQGPATAAHAIRIGSGIFPAQEQATLTAQMNIVGQSVDGTPRQNDYAPAIARWLLQ